MSPSLRLTTASEALGIGPDAFRDIMALVPSPVTVLTCYDRDGTPRGMTASSVTALSLTPPLVLACIDRRSRSHAALVGCPKFAVNVLGGHDTELARLFSAPVADRFAQCATDHGEVPLLVDAFASLTCGLWSVHDGGDHSIVVGRVEDVRRPERDDVPGLVWHRRSFGHVTPLASSA